MTEIETDLSMHSLDLSGMTQEEFNAEIQNGFDDAASGRLKTVDEVFSAIYEKYGKL